MGHRGKVKLPVALVVVVWISYARHCSEHPAQLMGATHMGEMTEGARYFEKLL